MNNHANQEYQRRVQQGIDANRNAVARTQTQTVKVRNFQNERLDGMTTKNPMPSPSSNATGCCTVLVFLGIGSLLLTMAAQHLVG